MYTHTYTYIYLNVGAFGGRFDQEIANIHALYKWSNIFERIVLIGGGNTAELLQPGSHICTHVSIYLYMRTNIYIYIYIYIIYKYKYIYVYIGSHICTLIKGVEGPGVSLLPLGCKVNSISTQGLHWDMTDMSLEMGHFISSSNKMKDECSSVVITTSDPVIWQTTLTIPMEWSE
jgi:thiamine pyrophosphokinase